jgi:hypothetical protein
MSDLENYEIIVEKIFGTGQARFDVNGKTNVIVKALNNPGDFSVFISNYTGRLNRLKSTYSTEPQFLIEIINKVNDVARDNWKGAFVELTTYDYLNHSLKHEYVQDKPVIPKVILDSSKTLAAEIGQTNVDFDAALDELGLYIDIKRLADIENEQLSGIIRGFITRSNLNDLHIIPQYSPGMYLDIANKRSQLVDELLLKIKPELKPRAISSEIIPYLSYRLL